MHNGPRGPKMDKSKDFVGSMKRLFKELKSFQILIAMALIFAILSSVLSIAAPNKLSKLTAATALFISNCIFFAAGISWLISMSINMIINNSSIYRTYMRYSMINISINNSFSRCFYNRSHN